MKKISLALLLFLIACTSVQSYDKEFKNPVFNQPLRPLSSTVGYEYLTPTSVELKGLLYKETTIYKGKCDLIENKQDRITLKCKGKLENGKQYNRYFTYVIGGILDHVPTCLRIFGYTYDKPENFPKGEIFAGKYCVTPMENVESELN